MRNLLSRTALGVALWVVGAASSFAQTAPSPDTLGVVRGTVEGRFQGERTPLSFAIVEAAGAGVRRSVVADSAGRYALTSLPSGDVSVRITRTGYAPLSLSVRVPAGGSVELDVLLDADPLRLPALNVSGEPNAAQPVSTALGESPPPSPEVELQALDLGPGLGQAGLLNVIGSLPGNDPADATDVLYLRGSTTDLKLVLLDGVPVYTPFHVGGLLRSFEPAVLGAADLHVGGAPARFDGGLSHILELKTRTARRDRLRLSGSLDLLAATGGLEAPLGERAGLLASARALHGLGEGPLGGARPYGYEDALVSADAELAEGHELRATGFWNAESVMLDPGRVADDARWSNRAGSLMYRADLGGPRLELTAGLSAYRARLPLQPSQLPGEPPPATLLASGATDRARMVGEVTWGPADAPWRTGASFEHIDASFDARSLAGASQARSRGATAAIGAFVDVTRPLMPGVSARGGLRVDHFTSGGTRLAPRAAVTLEVGPAALLTVAAGRYHQPTRTPDVEVERTLTEVAVDGLTSAELLPVATSDHVVVSLDQQLGRSVRLGLEGFWKGYEGLPTAVDETVRSSGVDLRLLTGGARGAAWLGYGLSWFWSTADLSGAAADFAGRHLLSAGLSGALGGPLKGEARLAYGAGLPYTSVPFRASGGSANQSASPLTTTERTVPKTPLVRGLDEAFLRLDVELYAVLEPAWGGHPWVVRPYVRLLNALDRRDALFYTFQPWRSDTATPLAERTVLPLLGVSVSF